MIEEELFRDYLPVRLKLPYEKGKLYSKIKENAIIENERAEEDCYLLDAKFPPNYTNLSAHTMWKKTDIARSFICPK